MSKRAFVGGDGRVRVFLVCREHWRERAKGFYLKTGRTAQTASVTITETGNAGERPVAAESASRAVRAATTETIVGGCDADRHGRQGTKARRPRKGRKNSGRKAGEGPADDQQPRSSSHHDRGLARVRCAPRMRGCGPTMWTASKPRASRTQTRRALAEPWRVLRVLVPFGVDRGRGRPWLRLPRGWLRGARREGPPRRRRAGSAASGVRARRSAAAPTLHGSAGHGGKSRAREGRARVAPPSRSRSGPGSSTSRLPGRFEGGARARPREGHPGPGSSRSLARASGAHPETLAAMATADVFQRAPPSGSPSALAADGEVPSLRVSRFEVADAPRTICVQLPGPAFTVSAALVRVRASRARPRSGSSRWVLADEFPARSRRVDACNDIYAPRTYGPTLCGRRRATTGPRPDVAVFRPRSWPSSAGDGAAPRPDPRRSRRRSRCRRFAPALRPRQRRR